MSQKDTGSQYEGVTIVARAVWQVMKKRDFENFKRIVDFLEVTHEQAPGLLCYRHYAKLSAGFRGKIVLNMFEDGRPLLDILEALNTHFPPLRPEDSAPLQAAHKVQQSKMHFRKQVLRMIRDERFRQNYLETKLQAEYGEEFLAALEKLLWEFLYRLQTVLSQQPAETTEQSSLETEDLGYTPVLPVTSSYSDDDVTVMQQHRDYLFPSDESSNTTEDSHTGLQHQEAKNSSEREPVSGDKGGTCDSNGRIHSGHSEHSPKGPPELFCSLQGSKGASNHTIVKQPFFDIFRYDCNEDDEVSIGQLSPPNPLQSQDTDCLQCEGAHSKALGRTPVTLVERNNRGWTNVAASAHEPLDPTCSVYGFKNKGQHSEGRLSPQRLASLRFQPKVYLKPLPSDLVRRYVDPQADSVQSDPAASTIGSELTPDSMGTYAWLIDSSATQDDYINDPDYHPGYDL